MTFTSNVYKYFGKTRQQTLAAE